MSKMTKMALGVLGLILYAVVIAAVSFGLETVSTDTANLARRLGVMGGVVIVITLWGSWRDDEPEQE